MFRLYQTITTMHAHFLTGPSAEFQKNLFAEQAPLKDEDCPNLAISDIEHHIFAYIKASLTDSQLSIANSLLSASCK